MPSKKKTPVLPPLTAENYYSKSNTAISNSKVSDFLKSREFYYRKHILGEVERNETRNMKIGSMIDDILSGNKPQYQLKVLKREDSDLYEIQKEMSDNVLVSQDMWDEAKKRAEKVMSEPAYQWYLKNNARFQVPMRTERKIEGVKVPLCGLADVITETPETVYIDDFKAVSSLKVSSPAKWWYNCLEMGYFRQLGVYQWLWTETHPGEKRSIVCRHLLSAKVESDLYQTHLFVIPQSALNTGLEQFFDSVNEIVRAMKNNDWSDPQVDWGNAVQLSAPNYDLKYAEVEVDEEEVD